MKTIKILLGIIAINLTLLTIIQTGVWPPKVQASETNFTESNLVSNDDVFAVASGGYLYTWSDREYMRQWSYYGNYKPTKKKLSNNKIPVSVGFGIKTAEAARKISLFSDGIIIGSSIVELIEKNQHNKALMHKKIIKFITSIRSSLGT